jgi:hypothetical protein
MAFLTDRTLATGVTPNDLIHIVVTGDTSQNSAGSSFKATMGQVLDLINPTTITGGTYNPITGDITFTNSSGGTFVVTGLVTGYTNTAVTAFTYNNSNSFTIFENDGSTYSASINVVTGLTINGDLNVTGTTSSQTISATTYQNLPTDIRVTGGTYSNGTATFTNNTGGTFNITGFFTSANDIRVTGATYSNNTFTYTNNTGGTFSVLFNTMTGLTINGDLNVTGTIFSTGSTQFISTTGITISAVTLSTGTTYNGINYAGNVDLTIPSPSGFTGLKIIIKDESGNAGTYRIRLTPSVGTIDGNPYVDMNINYMSLTLVARNNNWWII